MNNKDNKKKCCFISFLRKFCPCIRKKEKCCCKEGKCCDKDKKCCGKDKPCCEANKVEETKTETVKEVETVEVK